MLHLVTLRWFLHVLVSVFSLVALCLVSDCVIGYVWLSILQLIVLSLLGFRPFGLVGVWCREFRFRVSYRAFSLPAFVFDCRAFWVTCI